MTIEELKFLQENFSEEKVYLTDGYYRFKQLAADEYEIMFALPGNCGTSEYHPRIRFAVEAEQIVPISLMDVVATPVQLIDYSPETAAELTLALENLKNKFFAVKV
ncbi:hypothetical protein [Enterococcus sp. HY326]|uniref:hypothetical protein n=1 Tax=Enterococcus sp. HY326 TaxID=2971265 RepID=UPI00223EC9E3|nr:hypothetical protein [Enterococcus sp. HY326]